MPWYPLYHADFATDTQAWTAEQVGCLIRLMNYQWANGSVPVSHLLLARICSVETDTFKEIWQTLKPKFEPVASGHLLNRRLAIEHERQTAKREKARAAINMRWKKEREKKGLNTDVHTDGIPSSESESDTDSKREAAPPLPPGLNVEAWEDWLSYRREAKMKKWIPRTVIARTRMLALLSHDRQREIIQYSIDNGYAGLFPDRGGSSEQLSPTERVTKATGVKPL